MCIHYKILTVLVASFREVFFMRKLIIPLLITAYMLTINAAASQYIYTGGTVNINILSTADIHGRLDGYDYNYGVDLPAGLDRISGIINNERSRDKDAVVLDAGDFNRGSPMIDMYNTMKSNEANPVINIMNKIGYDGATPGNHDMDYGKKIMNKVVSEAEFPIVNGNIYNDDKLMFKPYEIIEKKGVRIGITGFTTTAALKYNSGDDIEGVKLKSVEKQAEKYINILRNEEKVDIVIVLLHSGIEGLFKAPEDETDAVKVANLSVKPDVIISGHSHMIVQNMNINGVIIQSPGAMGAGVGKIELLVRKAGSQWTVAGYKTRFLPAFLGSQDRRLKEDIVKYRTSTLEYLNTPAGYIKDGIDLDNNDLINTVKQKDAGAEIVVSENMKESILTKNNFLISDLYKLYGRENYMVGIITKGRNIKEYLESRKNRDPDNFNNLFGLSITYNNGEMNLYAGGKIIGDNDDVKLALTGRQLSSDYNIKKAGISQDMVYYNSYLQYGVDGRVRQRILWHIRNGNV
jgi:2',3'-cyclic-nucleotide 2'-phosphodiesterase/3'-nucleotidase